VNYLPERIVLNLPLLIPVHVALAARRPRAYARTLSYTLSRCFRQRSTSTLRRFFQAGFLIGWTLRKTPRIQHFHAHFCHGPATVAMFVKWLTGATFSFTAHAKDLYLTEAEILRDKMREAEFVLTCTAHNRDYLEKLGGNLTRVHLVYHGLDLSRFLRGSTDQIVPLASYADGARVPLVLSVGRLVEKKGFDTLIRACALLRDRGVRFRCLIYGDGEQRAALEELVAALGLGGSVELPGAVLQDDLVEIYRQSTLFALPCQILDNGDRDGLPNVLVEAMAMEIPVVSTDVSGIPELVEDGHNGFLIPPRSPEALADRMQTLLADGDLRREFAAAGRARVLSEFSLEANTRRILQLFNATLGLLPVELAPPAPHTAPLARQDASH